MTTNKKTNKPLKTYRVFGIEASVWPPNPDYDDDRPKVRLGRSYRDKKGAFVSTSYFAPEELAVAIEQAMKALTFTAPELVDQTMENLSDIARQMGQDTTTAEPAEQETA